MSDSKMYVFDYVFDSPEGKNLGGGRCYDTDIKGKDARLNLELHFAIESFKCVGFIGKSGFVEDLPDDETE